MKKDIKALLKIFKNIFYILSKKQKKKCCYIFFIILIGSLLETLGVSMILPFVQALLEPQKMLNNKYFAVLADILNIQSNMSVIFSVVISSEK